MLLLNNKTRYILKISFSLFCFILIGSLSYQLRLSQENKSIHVVQKQVLSQYEAGYDMGYTAAVVQFMEENENKIFSNTNQKFVTHTSEIDSEESIKGYEDGYHKAIESINCPR